MQKRVDPALAEALAAHRGDEGARSAGDPVAHIGGYLGAGENAGDRFGLVEPAPVADRSAQRRCLWRRGGEHRLHARLPLG